jgi:sugar phosphate isomerase/epimerase
LVFSRLSLNQKTTNNWSVREAVDGCARAGIPYIGLWRDKVAETGLAESARIVRESGIEVSSLCRGGMFPAPTAAERRSRLDDNKRAVDGAGYAGPIEVEIFNQDVWNSPGDETLTTIKERYAAHV